MGQAGGGICDFYPHLSGQNLDTKYVCQGGMGPGRKGNSLVSIKPVSATLVTPHIYRIQT